MITEKHMELFYLLYDLKLVQRDYLVTVEDGHKALMSMKPSVRDAEIKKFKRQMKEAEGVEGCFDYISHVEEVYERLGKFFKGD